MKKTVTLVGALLLSDASFAQTNWNVDASHSKLGFAVTHMMVSETEGNFKVYEGSVSSKSDADFTGAEIKFSVDVNSVNTEDEKRDGHLKSPDFFDAAKFPKMTFASTGMIKGKGKNEYTLTGNLTIKDVTKKVLLKVVYNGSAKDPWGNQKAGFKVTGKINRKDFGLTWNAALETGGVAVSEEVALNINIELNKAK